MPEMVTVSCRQVPSVVGDAPGNRRRITAEARAAAAAGADIVLFPELAASGYDFASAEQARAEAVPLDGPLLDEWRALAGELGIVLVAGYAELGDNGHVYNSAVLIDPDGVRANYRKAHLWDREADHFTPGAAPPPVVDTILGRLGLLICYDLEFPEWVRLAALDGAELLCAPVSWPAFPRPAGERPNEVVKVQAGAGVNRMPIAVCDRVDADHGAAWLGGSVIVDPDGYPLTSLALGEEAAITATIDLAASRDKSIGERNDVLADRRPPLYGAITKERV
ncbi:hypothetical protein Atai01_46180 [Amycolatopsis taiwanensis]|uniref:CN hydrolase domain-containing protein n=2 Tax=Amycolatopsis taiwanensis TaxID=342230 RepID=A0A9W6R1U3_9PSEU|nr:hypothetical protein Atai01_46180 [Amycolatopsis taiwanensis]